MHDVHGAPRGADRDRGGRREERPRNRNNEARQREDRRPLALSFVSINYDATSHQLVAVVQATRGNRPAEALTIQLLVPPTPIGTGTTDRNGRVTITADVNYPPKTYPLIVETLDGEYAQHSGAFVVPQPFEVTEQTPMLEVTTEHTKVGDDFSLIATVTARRGNAPIQNQQVYLSINDGTPSVLESAWTNAQGVAQKRFTVVVGGRKTIPVTVTANMTGATPRTALVTLESEPCKPVTMPYRASEVDEANSIWEIVANPEDAQHNPCKGVRLTMSVENGTLLSPAVVETNEHGEARFRVQASQIQEKSKFTIDCPSIRNNGIVRLWRYINPQRTPAPRLFRFCDILAGTSAIIVLVCALLLVTGVWRRATSSPNQSAVTDVVQTTHDDGLTDVERNVYKYSTLDTSRYSKSSKVHAEAATRDSLAAVPKERSGIPFGIGIGTLFMTIFISALLFVCSVVTIVFIKLKRLKELSTRYLWEIHEGVADNDPGFLQRVEDFTLAARNPLPATAAGTPAAGAAPAAKKEGGFMSHLPAVAMFGFVDLIVDKLLTKGRK